MHTKTKIRVMTVATMALIAVWATDLDACSTPVFRYALERWPADYFPAVVFHRGELSAEHKRVVEIIRKAASEDGANIGVYDVDLDKKLDKGTTELWERHKSLDLPAMVVTYSLPYSGRGRPRYPDDPFPPTFWTGEITEANARALVDSPIRKEIARRILAGDSAVWVVVEPDPDVLKRLFPAPAKTMAYSSGTLVPAGILLVVGLGGLIALRGRRDLNGYFRALPLTVVGLAVLVGLAGLRLEEPADDPTPQASTETQPAEDDGPVTVAKAEEIVQQALTQAEDAYARNKPAVPTPPPPPSRPGFGPPEAPANLKVQFSTIRLSRKTADERMFLAMLMHSEKDLLDEEYAVEPMVFPVFGRGRVLWALVGKGINDENMFESCMYITGACSCEVKFQNPGTDLLFSKDWDEALADLMVKDEPIADLRGVPEGGEEISTTPPGAAEGTADASDADQASAGPAPKSGSSGLVFTVVAVTLGILAVGGTALLMVLKRKTNVE